MKKVKQTAITVVMLLLPNFCHAQKIKEWIAQNKTQKQYLTQQIANLKIYLELTKKGYQIAREGLTTIGDIKRAEFKLHKNHFDSLLIVNPRIGSSSRLKQITALHGRINQTCETLPGALGTSFDASQIQYINKVLKLVYDDSQSVLSNLFVVIRDKNLAMRDDERIERIELCFQQMQDNYSFVKNFDQQTRLLASQKRNEHSQIITEKNIHGLN